MSTGNANEYRSCCRDILTPERIGNLQTKLRSAGQSRTSLENANLVYQPFGDENLRPCDQNGPISDGTTFIFFHAHCLLIHFGLVVEISDSEWLVT